MFCGGMSFEQRDTKSISGSIINFKNVQVSNDDEILLGWADYFKDLATPTSMPEFDKAFLQQAENDVKNLYNLYTNDRQETRSVMALLFLVRWIFSTTLPIRFVIVIFL
jgi:hypothetical protein